MVRVLGFHCCGPGSVPGQGTEILQAAQHSQKKKKKKKKKKTTGDVCCKTKQSFTIK